MTSQGEIATDYEPYPVETLAHFQRKLIEEKISIQAKLQKNSDPIFIEELRNNFATSDERAKKTEAIVKHKQEREDEERKLADVEAALDRIENGSYGLCVDCKKGILLERLRAIPTATRCVLCQATKEHERSVSLAKRR